jgi:hypothetical protein
VSTGRKLLIAGVLLALAVGSTVWFASGGDDELAKPKGPLTGPNGTGVTAVLPAGWTGSIPGSFELFAAERAPEPQADQGEGLECEPGYTKILRIRMSEGGDGPVEVPVVPRPGRFTGKAGRVDDSEGGDTCWVRDQYIAFTDHGRTFYVDLGIGRGITDEELQEAYSMLDSLTIKD